MFCHCQTMYDLTYSTCTLDLVLIKISISTLTVFTDDMTKKGHVSRRKVAAISFLSNIKAEGETEDDLPGYKCLQDTQVLEQYRRQSRHRRKIARAHV